MHYLVILTVYDGQESSPPQELENLDFHEAFSLPETDSDTAPLVPTFLEHAKFELLHVPRGSSAISRRWLRVHAAEYDGREVVPNKEHAVFGANGVSFYIVPVELTWSTLSLSETLKLEGGIDASGQFRGASLSKFEDVAGKLEGDTAASYQICKDDQQIRDFPGVHAITEPCFRVHPGPDDDFFSSIKSHTTFHPHSDLTTLANFVTAHCISLLGSLQSDAGVAMLKNKLRGAHIHLSRSCGAGVYMIKGFREGKAADVPASERHYARPSEGSLFLSFDLPLVNLGTSDKPVLLPMEVCLIDDDQKIRGPRDLSLNRYISSINRESALREMSIGGEPAQGQLVFHHVPELRSEDMEKRLGKVCNDLPPVLLFVEIAPTKVTSRQWRDLRDEFLACTSQSFQNLNIQVELPTSGDTVPLLSLRPEAVSDLSSKWTLRLQKFVLDNDRPGRKTIVVVWLDSPRDRNMMYNGIKTMCDLKAGAQTFFVNRTNYEARLWTTSVDLNIAKRTAAIIRHRICQKNPHMLKTSTADQSNLVIAMHVAKVSDAVQFACGHLGQKFESGLYIVTLVSRDMTRSENYHTERGVYSKTEIQEYFHVSLLKAFLDRLSKHRPCNIIVLRSGYMDPTARHTQPSPCKSDSPGSFSPMRDVDSPVDAGATDLPSAQVSQKPSATGEIEVIKDLYKTSGLRSLTYVTLTEDSFLETRIRNNGDYGTFQPSKETPTMLFIHDAPFMDAEERSIKVQQVQAVREDDQVQPEVRPVPRPGAITATFHGAAQLTDESKTYASKLPKISGLKSKSLQVTLRSASRTTPQKSSRHAGRSNPQRYSSQQTPSPLDPLTRITVPDGESSRASAAEDRLDNLPARSPTFQSPMQTKARDDEAAEQKVTPAEIDLLVAIWNDDALGLHNTKWPVPTHLARLAAKRALVHLCKGDSHFVSGNNNAPAVLPKVDEVVRDTLYYL